MRLARRLAAAALAAGLALAAVFAASAPATAADPDAVILVFSNTVVTDVDEEDASLIADLESTGAAIGVFDGGDGSAAAWAEALDGVDVLVLPENATQIYDPAPADTPYLSVDAQQLLLDFVEAGGIVFVSDPSGTNGVELFSFLTGVDYTGWTTGADAPYLRVSDDDAWPEQLIDVSATTALDLASLSGEQLDPLTPYYVSDQDFMAIGEFDAAGSGLLFYLAWDWFPFIEGDYTQDEIDAWSAALVQLVEELFPTPAEEEPALPDTGAGDAPLMAGAGLLALLGGVTLLAVRRKFAAQG